MYTKGQRVMNKKPGLLFSVLLFAFIVLAASFNMNLDNRAAVKLRAGINPADVLYICPADNTTWLNISHSMHALSKYASIFFLFVGIVLFFSWGWALYQNLLKDKFVDDAYKTPWMLTKGFFWILIIFTLLVVTPNHYREVKVRGQDTPWVLCDSDSAGARAVGYNAVSSR